MTKVRIPASVLTPKPVERSDGHPICARCEEPIGNLPPAAQLDATLVTYCSLECTKLHPMRKEATS